MTAGLTRILVCLLLFGWGAEALHGLGEGVAVTLSGVVALAINHLWRDQQRQRFAREHHDRVIADEELRLAVRERKEAR